MTQHPCHGRQGRTAVHGLLATVLCTLLAAPATATEELVFLTWADYIDPELVVEFEREHDLKVKFAYYESDDSRDELMAESDGHGYDLAIVNGLMLQSYSRSNWLAPVGTSDIGNLRHVESRWRKAFPASERYGVPYFWGTLGIAYRADLVPAGFDSWMDFFRPSQALSGRITLLKSSRDLMGMALKTLGHSVNTNDRKAIRSAGDLLETQRPFVRSYEYIALGEESALVTGEVWASLAYSGDALMVQEHNENIAYVVPEEGSNLWVDYFAVLQSSPRKDLAAQFIDFLNRPEVAARNAQFVYYATPNLAAREHVSDDYLEDPIIFPNPDVIARSETYRELAPRTQKTVNAVFAQLVN